MDRRAGQKESRVIVKPTNFDPNKKYPLVVLIHGGPQSAWNNNWGYRWNPQVFADTATLFSLLIHAGRSATDSSS